MITQSEILEAMQFGFLNANGPVNTTSDPAYTISYQYAGTSAPADLPTSSVYTGWTAFTAAEKTAIRAQMDHIETLLNVSFVEVTGDPDPFLNIGNVDLPGSTAGYGGYSASTTNGAITGYDGFAVYDNTLDLETDASLLLHELGHALGLKHPFSAPALPSSLDSNKYTLMSYTTNPDNGLDSDAMMLFDVLALQNLWGAAENNPTNTAYTGSRTTTVDAIWDSGGKDVFNASAKTTAVRLDLRESAFSKFGTYDDVVITFGTVIENAKGGSKGDRITGNDVKNTLTGNAGYDTIAGGLGNDVLYGNAGKDKLTGGNGKDQLYGGNGNDSLLGSKGNDTLKGGQGADTLSGQKGTDQLYGGGGADSFVYNSGAAKDVVRDFENDVDEIHVNGFGSKASVLALAVEQNGNVVFDFGDGDILNIRNTTIADVTDDLFV